MAADQRVHYTACMNSWQQVIALGPEWRADSNLADSRQFAQNFMLRLRETLECIVERLRAAGYVFRWPQQVLVSPANDILAQLDELESVAGALPLSLRAAYEHFGTCNLEGDLPDWPCSANVFLRAAPESAVWLTDPLVLAPIEQSIEDAYDMQGSGRAFPFPIAADPVGKAGFSGGRYFVLLPNDGVDMPLNGAAEGLSFLSHLEACLANGGFAGFAGIEEGPQTLLDSLTAGCLDLRFR